MAKKDIAEFEQPTIREKSRGDIAFQYGINIISILIAIVTLYPLVYVVSASLSQPVHILNGNVWLWPVDITLKAYKRVFSSNNILVGYRNTMFYAGAGTAINVILTIMAAYPLAQKGLRGRNGITFLITFTMFFSGGMIPSYLNVKSLNMLNTVWAVLLPGAINATNMLILRNYFINSVPGELTEAAEIDGCSPLGTMFRIVLPLSRSILVVIVLYYLVGRWNAYFEPMVYLRNNQLWPLQVFLRQILLLSQMGDMAETLGVSDLNTAQIYAALKYAIIVVSSVPLLILYPFVQRFFQKGIMMGSIKG
ncbi:MAG: carbohydrate ABC transporter permease [Clostridia bacterium]|nr:carbohydrate ABC transporter permease [Clostridia bacterium]